MHGNFMEKTITDNKDGTYNVTKTSTETITLSKDELIASAKAEIDAKQNRLEALERRITPLNEEKDTLEAEITDLQAILEDYK